MESTTEGDPNSILPPETSREVYAARDAFIAGYEEAKQEHRILKRFVRMLEENLGNQGRSETESKDPNSLSYDAQIAARTIIGWIDALGEEIEIDRVIDVAVFRLQNSPNLFCEAPAVRIAITKALVREAVHITRASS